MIVDAPRAAGLVMVVDDEPINRMVLRLMVEDAGWRVIEAESGPEALHLLAREPVDLLLLDLHMPAMDGIAVAVEVQRLKGDAEQTPIIAVTADDTRSAAQLRPFGFAGLLAKPISISGVQEVLRAWPPRGRTQAAP